MNTSGLAILTLQETRSINDSMNIPIRFLSKFGHFLMTFRMTIGIVVEARREMLLRIFIENNSLIPPFHWTAIPLRSWRSRIFSKIIPNRRGSVDSHTSWGLDASSTLSLRFYYASITLLLRSHYDNENLATLSLR